MENQKITKKIEMEQWKFIQHSPPECLIAFYEKGFPEKRNFCLN